MVIHDELKSEPCPTIHYTYNEILEGLRDALNCPTQSKLTQSWGEKWTRAKPTF